MRADAALRALRSSLGAPDADPEFEGLVAGRPDAKATSALACAMPSVAVLRRAVAERRRLVVADGHPYYLYDVGWASQRGTAEALAASSVTAAKRRLIDDAGIAVVRLTTAWRNARRGDDATALARAVGLWPRASRADADFVVADAPPGRLDAVAKRIATVTGSGGMRLVGDSEIPVRRVAVATGLASPSEMRAMLADPTVDAVLCGEVNEWEAGPYVQDAIASGRRFGLILCGFAASRTPAAASMADWARSVLPGVDVAHADEALPVWSPRRGSGS